MSRDTCNYKGSYDLVVRSCLLLFGHFHEEETSPELVLDAGELQAQKQKFCFSFIVGIMMLHASYSS